MKVIHLKTGWDEPDFEQKIQQAINEQSENGFSYYDIKVSSGKSDCLLIFKKDSDSGMMSNR
jgi:hypothetical protein